MSGVKEDEPSRCTFTYAVNIDAAFLKEELLSVDRELAGEFIKRFGVHRFLHFGQVGGTKTSCLLRISLSDEFKEFRDSHETH